MVLGVELSSASDRLAQELRDLLASKNLRLVLAESCTGGNVAASLAILPGISQWLCGSFVVYRNASKQNWLGLDPRILDDPRIGPVSQQVTRLLAESALLATPEAGVSVAVTGHLGPTDDHTLDGLVFGAFCLRSSGLKKSTSFRLVSPSPKDARDITARRARLNEATACLLDAACKWLRHAD